MMPMRTSGRLLLLLAGDVPRRVVRVAVVVPATATHEGGGTRLDAPPVGGAYVLVVVPGEPHLVRRLIDEHVVLHTGCGVTVEVHDRRVADVLTRWRALEEHREVLELIRRPEG